MGPTGDKDKPGQEGDEGPDGGIDHPVADDFPEVMVVQEMEGDQYKNGQES